MSVTKRLAFLRACNGKVRHVLREFSSARLEDAKSLNYCSSSTKNEHCETRDYAQNSSFIDVTPLAAKLRRQVFDYTSKHSLKLVGILASPTTGPFRDDAELYSEQIAETFREVSIDYETWRCNSGSPESTKSLIQMANQADDVDGILVFYPVFQSNSQEEKGDFTQGSKLRGAYYKSFDDTLREFVAANKDVEGLRGIKWYHHQSMRRSSLSAAASVFPCTALSVQKVLEEYHLKNFVLPTVPNTSSSFPWYGQTVSIVNRSDILGRPLAAMLAAAGATVYSIDADSILKFRPYGRRLQRCMLSLRECIAESSILVTGVPDTRFRIPAHHISRGTTIVNVSEFPNIDEVALLERSDIQYIPQVGKVTVAILAHNLVQLHRQNQ